MASLPNGANGGAGKPIPGSTDQLNRKTESSGHHRPEITGLRAVAVMPVVLFHAGLTWVSGGFLGVDIFFVISGFLITRIITFELEAGKFSLRRFYERRIRRILPAMLAMGAICVPPAIALMLPDDLENFGQSLIATALSANNVLLFATADYFDQASAFKPLLHTWSLGVEEQYYLVIPLALMLAYKAVKRAGVTLLVAIATCVSFAISVWASSRFPDANFYLPFSRAWELGAGGLLALSATTGASTRLTAGFRGFAAAVGMLLILGSLVLIDETTSLPSWASLPCVIGTLLVIHFARGDGLVGRMLASSPAVWIGLLSYSLYLYHQPLFVFLRVSALTPPPLHLMLIAIVPLFVVSYASWRFVEEPFRDPRRTSTRSVVALCVSGMLGLSAVGATMHLSSGFKASWPELTVGDPGFGAAQNAAYNSSAQRLQTVELPARSSRKRILVIGNSFARDFINMGLATGYFDDHLVSYIREAECSSPDWPSLAARRLPNADFVVLGSEKFLPCLAMRAAYLRRAKPGKFVVIGTKSFGWNNNAVMLLPRDVRYLYRTKPLAEDAAMNEAARAVFDPREYVDVIAMLSNSEGTVPVFTPDRKFISQDRRHLTEAGAKYIGEIVFRHPSLAGLRPAVSDSSPD
jgi:peptidoglycan/LPS O-acetylase OafA/YrhL